MIDAFTEIDALLRGGCDRVFSGAVARIERDGALCFERAYGRTRADEYARAVYVDTRFDLASLTKLFVATLLLRSVSERLLGLDEPLVAYFPVWRGSRHAAITARMLLAHDSGMNSGADYRSLLDRSVIEFALEEPLAAAPGERVIYSDLGFIVLGVLLERLHRRSLATMIEDVIARPRLGFRPGMRERLSIPATEDDGWRGRVQGSVHDEKAHSMGGVAGHAGLFGTAADVAWLTSLFLDPLCGRDEGLVSADLAREAVREQAADPVLRRGLGWALKTNDENSCGRHLSMSSFGHTGFVGTCVWADPQRDLLGVLLTNSVYFGRSDTTAFRAAFYDAAARMTEHAAR
jgi:serine-type D-Ala-D-Ala carboxypeptidase